MYKCRVKDVNQISYLCRPQVDLTKGKGGIDKEELFLVWFLFIFSRTAFFSSS